MFHDIVVHHKGKDIEANVVLASTRDAKAWLHHHKFSHLDDLSFSINQFPDCQELEQIVITALLCGFKVRETFEHSDYDY